MLLACLGCNKIATDYGLGIMIKVRNYSSSKGEELPRVKLLLLCKTADLFLMILAELYPKAAVEKQLVSV